LNEQINEKHSCENPEQASIAVVNMTADINEKTVKP
jgi:hypothetical protein